MDREAYLARLVHGMAVHGVDAATIARSAGSRSVIVAAMTHIDANEDDDHGALSWQGVLAVLHEALALLP